MLSGGIYGRTRDDKKQQQKKKKPTGELVECDCQGSNRKWLQVPSGRALQTVNRIGEDRRNNNNNKKSAAAPRPVLILCLYSWRRLWDTWKNNTFADELRERAERSEGNQGEESKTKRRRVVHIGSAESLTRHPDGTSGPIGAERCRVHEMGERRGGAKIADR